MVYLASYTMLARTPDDAMVGCQAARISLDWAYGLGLRNKFQNGDSMDWATVFWTVSNFAFLLSYFLVRRPRTLKYNPLLWVYAAAALTPVWAFDLFDNLGPGFYAWWLSFVLLFAAFCLRPLKRAAGRPTVPTKLQFSLSMLLILALAGSALMGLNFAYQNYLINMAAYDKSLAHALIPCQVLASLLALALFFDLWEARRRRAEAAK
ncbi:MAG: hypothetical protein L6R28_19710 [Planctomycetes bacterium]|nr:hypothetical protein [Planctomycetota bacterium]